MRKIVLLLLCVAVFSCKKDDSVPDAGYSYFPTEPGSYVIYDVDSFVYNDFTSGIDTFRFQVKEIIESVYQDNSGRNTQRIERYYRKNDSQAWTLQDVWAANASRVNVERVEENQRFIKLVFPVRKNAAWNGNAYNTNGEQKYIYSYADIRTTVNKQVFDSTLMVTQQADSNLVEKKLSQEIYARHVGLIYKHYVSVRDNDTSIDPTKTFNERIDSGVDCCYRVNVYGKQ